MQIQLKQSKLRGRVFKMVYPKFKNKEECAYPKRKDCNGDTEDCKIRCEFMKYDDSKSISDPSRWRCIYKKTNEPPT